MNRRIGILIVVSIVILSLVLLFLVKPTKKTDSELIKDTQKYSAEEIFNLAKKLEKDGELLNAQQAYQKLTNNYLNFDKIQEATQRLGQLNIKIITSGLATEETVIYKVKPNDSLSKIAKEFNTTVDLIKKSNLLNSDIIRVGAPLRIWTGKFSCVVDKSQNILILKTDDRIIKTYTVSTGMNNSTPTGVFHIINKLIDPVWYKTGAIVPPESPENILGSRWLGFDLAGYGIHGTTQPSTIGQQVTKGCVRMTNPDVEELYMLLPSGTEVTIVD